MKHLLAILALVVLMGPSGRMAFSEITGLNILAGWYDLRDDGAIVHVRGVDKSGVTWMVIAPWRDGYPQEIILYAPEVGL
jgi:hypothetical protein